jgi:hypothetical protein
MQVREPADGPTDLRTPLPERFSRWGARSATNAEIRSREDNDFGAIEEVLDNISVFDK